MRRNSESNLLLERHIISASCTPKRTKNSDIKGAMVKKTRTNVVFFTVATKSSLFLIGGEYRARTCDPLLVRQMLSQLS